MPGVSLAHFFPGGAPPTPALGAALEQAPAMSTSPGNLLLFGPERSGKTTLLFHLAYALAAQGAAVLIVGSRDRFEYSPPALGPALAPSAAPWAAVRMKYLESEAALLQYASLLHLSPEPPTVILVDDLDRMAGPPGGGSGGGGRGERPHDAGMCRLLAVLCDSLDHIARASGRPTLLAATATTVGSQETPRLFPLMARWLPVAVRCWAHGRLWRMAAYSPAEGCPPAAWAADYTLDHGLRLERLRRGRPPPTNFFLRALLWKAPSTMLL